MAFVLPAWIAVSHLILTPDGVLRAFESIVT
jgi:hypothetical protein